MKVQYGSNRIDFYDLSDDMVQDLSDDMVQAQTLRFTVLKWTIWFIRTIRVGTIKRNSLINIVRSLCIYEAIITIGTLKRFTNTLKIVKNKYIYEVASLNSSTLLDKFRIGTLSQFFFQGSR